MTLCTEQYIDSRNHTHILKRDNFGIQKPGQKKQRSVQMAAFVAEVEWLRPLVNDHHWDYSVIWKLGDDPSRFIEWGACCCSGGKRGKGIKIIKDENEAKRNLIGECRDEFVEHSITSKACLKLSQLPSQIPLYSGIHGEAVISQRPQWIIQRNSSVSDDELNGTHVLIPIDWGLIELFSTKEVPIDQNIVDYISDYFKVCCKQENMRENWDTNFTIGEEPFHIPNWVNNLNFHPSISQPNNYSSFEGSSTCSSLSNEHQILKIGSDQNVFSGVSPEYSSKNYVDPTLKRKKHTDCAVGVKNRQKGEKGQYKSKNLITERKRRKRIKDGMLVLRTLVPKITKMDRLATLADSVDYIKELLTTIENFHDEIRAIDDEDCSKVEAKQDPTLLIKDNSSEKSPIVVEVEVNQTGRKDFLIRLICKQRRCAFSKLMEAVDSLGLQVTYANITTLNGLVLNNVKVEAKTMEVEVNTLKHSLVELLIN